MTEQTKSLIRHALVAAGTIAALLGINVAVPILDYAIANLDALWAAVVAIVGIVTGIFGFFKNKERFELRAAANRK